MATTLNLLLPTATPQAIAVPPIPELQALPDLNFVPEQPTLEALQLPGLAASATFPPSIDQLLDPDLSTPMLPTIDVEPSQPDPTPLPVLDPEIFESWFLNSPPDIFPDPSPTDLEPPWFEFTDWHEPHGWWPAPTILMPAPLFGFPIVDRESADKNTELLNPLPTAMPESMLGPIDPEIIEAGSVVDRSYDWAFFDQGDVAIDGEILSAKDGSFTRWLRGDTTYAGLFNDGLLIGPHLVPYPEEYRQWMQDHNILIWN